MPQTFVAQSLLALAAGAAVVPAFAPLQCWPLAILSLALLFALWLRAASPLRAAVLGFTWGMGCFLCGVSWLFVSLHDFGNMPAGMAALAVTVFCAYLALFPALAGGLQGKIAVSPVKRALLVMPAMFVCAEMLRGWFMTGFPWLIVGYTQTPSPFGIAPLAGVAPLFGVFGISLLLAKSAGAVVLFSTRLSGAALTSRARRNLIAALAAIWGGGVVLGSIDWSQPTGAPLTVSLLQGNVPQHLKWREDQRAATIDNYLDLVDHAQGRLIVLPETAIPLMLHDIPSTVLTALQRRAIANGGELLLGVAYADAVNGGDHDVRYFNGAVALGDGPPQRYAKQHLVAFGEFVPPLFAWIYRWLTIPLSGFTPGATDQPPLMLGGQRVAINICYEDTFGAEIAQGAAGAALMVNLSNMAWYGRSLAAAQHVQFSQMRSLENARWMLRSTNTGVTAAIDHTGRIVAELPQFTRGVLEVAAVPRQGITPYARWRDVPVWLMLALLLCAAWRMRRR